MTYKAIYAYAWDLAETGIGSRRRTIPRARPRHRDHCRQLPCRQVSAPPRQGGKGVFPRRRNGLFQDRSPPLRCSSSPSPTASWASATFCVSLRREAARSPLTFGWCFCTTRCLASSIRNRPSPTRSGIATSTVCAPPPLTPALMSGGPRTRRYREICGRGACRWRRRGFFPMPMASTMSLLSTRPTAGSTISSGFAFAATASAERRVPASTPPASRPKWPMTSALISRVMLIFPADMAEAFWRADIVADGDLDRYLACRNGVVTSLVAEIRAEVRADAAIAVIPSVSRPTGGAWYEGSDLGELAEATGIIEACFYKASGMRVKADLFDVRRRLNGQAKLRGSSGHAAGPRQQGRIPRRGRCLKAMESTKWRSTTGAICAGPTSPGSGKPCGSRDER